MNPFDTASRNSPTGKGRPPWRRYASDIRNSLVWTAAATMLALSSSAAIVFDEPVTGRQHRVKQ